MVSKEPNQMVRLRRSLVHEMHMLKWAWKLKNLNEVQERLIAPHRAVKFKALNIQVADEENA